MNDIFYVYALKYPDGTPFYIGKGKENRLDAHEKEAKMNKAPEFSANPQKINIIRKIWQNGGQVIKEKVVENLTEEQAFEIEIELIEKYGLRNHGGLLANLTYGGEGTSGFEYTWEQWEQLKQRAKQVGEVRKEDRQQKATEAYVTAYAKISKKLNAISARTEEEKRIIAEGYAEIMAYLARNIFHGSIRENEAKKGAWHIIRNLNTEVAFRYLVEEASKIGKIEAKRQAKEIKRFAINSNLFTEEKAEIIANEKAKTYVDRRYTGKYGRVLEEINKKDKSAQFLTEEDMNFIIEQALKYFLAGSLNKPH